MSIIEKCMNKLLKPAVWIMAIVCLCACDSAQRDTARQDPAGLARPESIRQATLSTGKVICPLEIINGDSIRRGRSFPAGSKATLVGWSTVANRDEPVPPLVHVVFRSTVPDGSADLFWPGKRVARPELSQNDERLANSGYAAVGNFPTSPGKYKVLVWVGDEKAQRECDTGEVFDLQP